MQGGEADGIVSCRQVADIQRLLGRRDREHCAALLVNHFHRTSVTSKRSLILHDTYLQSNAFSKDIFHIVICISSV